jgi:hypothetical protein
MGAIFLAVPLLVLIEWVNRDEEYALKRHIKNKYLRWSFYITIGIMIIELGGGQQGFIYFQF